MERHRINLDFETRSRCDLPTCGAYKYAEDPSTEVLVIAVSVDGGDVVTWDYRDDMMDDDWQEHYAIHVLRRAIEEGWEIHAFNSQFEWCILKYVCPRQFGFPVPDINNMRCTAAVCRSAGLPPSLAACADFLKLPVQKDKAGKTLIQKFSVPQKDGRFIEYDSDEEFTVGGTRVTAKNAFQMFVDYCKRDGETEMAVAVAMKPFELSGLSLETFLLTARLNDRGVPVDKTALENAMRLYQEHEAELEAGFQAITGLSPSQNLRVLEWMRERGYGGNSLDAENRARYGPGVTDPAAAKALAIKAELSFAAVKKIPAMLDWVQDDGFIRGSFLWCGAQKTGRWTSKGPQWQNMKKPKKAFRPLTGPAYDDIAGGIDLELLGLCYGNPYEVIASLSRYFVRYPDANIFDADFSQVEARILPQLIGCKRIMDSFGGGSDLYTVVGNRLGVDRDTGKTIVLATQFQGGWSAVFNATGKKWDRSRCEEAVKTVRDENPEFAVAWRRCQDAFVAAMDNPGKWQQATEYTRIAYTSKPPFPRVLLRLPSGRKIVMPYPKKDPITMVKIVRTLNKDGESKTTTKWERHNGHLDDEDLCYEESSLRVFALPGESVSIESHFHTWELSFYGHVENSQYGRVNTYGGDILQSCLAEGTLVVTRNGAKPIESITDMDEVWDGETWVSCDGAIEMGSKECLYMAGIFFTPDHKFMVDNCWHEGYNLSIHELTSQSKRLVRDAIRSSDRDLIRCIRENWNPLAGTMRLRKGEGVFSKGLVESGEDPEDRELRKDMRVQRLQKAEEARLELSPVAPHPRLHDGEMLPGEQPELQTLRSEGNPRVQQMEEILELLQRHDPRIPEGPPVGQDGQHEGVLPKELPLGDSEGKHTEQEMHDIHEYPEGEDEGAIGGGRVRDKLHDAPVQNIGGGPGRGDVPETGCIKKVYDLSNCGPNSRYAILTEEGMILSHNCTQAVGADLLACGVIEAERQGFEPFLLVHDQCLAKARGDKDAFAKALCTVPDWFSGFPLDASADEVRSYSKT